MIDPKSKASLEYQELAKEFMGRFPVQQKGGVLV
jgi:hypothetical protein